jgi:hypothetical protein
MASIAVAYRSRRSRDSSTMNSAKIRTRSLSLAAAASFAAKAWCRLLACSENCSEWGDPGLDVISGGAIAVSLLGMCGGNGRPGEPISNLDCGGGVSKAFGGMAGDLSIKAALI